jgi:HSP20 family protein
MTIFRRIHTPAFLDFLEFNRMRNQMENIWGSLRGKVEHFKDNYANVFPLLNVYESDDCVTLTAELPGVKAEDLEISIKSDTLTLAGEKKINERPQDANFFRQERISGSFRRSLTLPAKVDPEKAEAKFKNGIITVTLPKAAEAKAHSVSVKTD